MIALVEAGATKGHVQGFGQYVYDLPGVQAKAFADEAFRECGLSPDSYSRADNEKIVTLLRENYQHLSKHDMVDLMCAVNGKTYITNQATYNFVGFMIEWSKQEKLACTKDQKLKALLKSVYSKLTKLLNSLLNMIRT